MTYKEHSGTVLTVSDLTVKNLKNNVKIVDRLSLQVEKKEVVSLLGESGSGKSMTSLAIMGLTHNMSVEGSIVLENKEISSFTDKSMSAIRGSRMAMIFQNPMSSLNPVKPVGKQISEVLLRHTNMSSSEAYEYTLTLLEDVKLNNPRQCYQAYAHELSGGMCQRVMIAMAIACKPALLIADEPTTALDMTVQQQIMTMLMSLSTKYGMSILFITHDLHVAQRYSHRTYIMYAGQIVEEGPTSTVFNHPAHPYTTALLSCIPDNKLSHTRFGTIAGQIPDLRELPPGCNFSPRCPIAQAKCSMHAIPLSELERGRWVRCIYPLGGQA
ncbi:ABC transporter ATP-binding protein [Acetobacter syzygii]|uniref:ABC transporter ATP-binding protein n=1 Tax=Acetobacter syzygii TaxID=146476 RepID=UPI00156F98EF|nr:ABC transporter ATP-binding protein [Acetobacter syzygii]NSL91568.1 ABC transporter ATP-binding protein [Acetobacter syzygii]